MDFIKKIVDRFRKVKNNNNFYSLSTTKHSMTNAYTLKFSTQTEQKKKEINEQLKVLVKKYIDSPEKLIQYMTLKGLKVYKIRKADIILKKLGEEEGFLTPLKGFKALIINFIIGILYEEKFKIEFSTREMFIFDVGATEIYTIARALHKYYGFKNNLPGFDYKSQEIFKRVYNRSHNRESSPFARCSTLKDMYSCKEAIARDLEAINFSLELSREHEQAKKALAKLKETNSANI